MSDKNIRYYYDCPIEAAYMAKHFGMKFGLKHEGRIIWDCQSQGMSKVWNPISDWRHICEDAGTSNALDAYYIHPDSLHILEPDDEDMDENGYVYSSGAESWIDIYSEFYKKKSQTIFREGKHFFWPKQET